jgi:hypothetical protein
MHEKINVQSRWGRKGKVSIRVRTIALSPWSLNVMLQWVYYLLL